MLVLHAYYFEEDTIILEILEFYGTPADAEIAMIIVFLIASNSPRTGFCRIEM